MPDHIHECKLYGFAEDIGNRPMKIEPVDFVLNEGDIPLGREVCLIAFREFGYRIICYQNSLTRTRKIDGTQYIMDLKNTYSMQLWRRNDNR